MDLKKRKAKEGVAIFDGEPIHFAYLTGSFTPALLSKLQMVQNEQKKTEPNIALMADVCVDLVFATVQSWDIVAGGEPVPITREALQDVPFEVLNTVIGAINKDQSPNPTN